MKSVWSSLLQKGQELTQEAVSQVKTVVEKVKDEEMFQEISAKVKEV